MKIKILGIAPYKILQSTMEKLAQKRCDIELTVYVGDLLEGVKIVKEMDFSKYDIIISRGGTAKLLQNSVSVPVVEIPITIYDILRTIKLAENYNSKHAIVGYPSISENAITICDLLQYNIDVYTVNSPEEINDTLNMLYNKGYRMVLGDVITTSIAKQFNMSSILITSGTESIETAFDQAINTYLNITRSEKRKEFYNSILSHLNCKVFVFNDQQELIHSGSNDLTPDMLSLLKQNVHDILNDSHKNISKEFDHLLLQAFGTHMSYCNCDYVVYSVYLSTLPFVPSHNGFRYLSKESATNKFYESFYGVSNTNSSLYNSIMHFSKVDKPLMILGENGTGKEQMVYLVYSKSKLQNNPLVAIDCTNLNNKSWNYLVNNYKSPLHDNNITIYIRDIDAMSENQFHELISIIDLTNLAIRNRLIFTYNCTKKETNLNRYEQIINKFSCLTLHIPPLRYNVDNIPNLASLYIGYLNIELGKEISGFEPGGLDLLKSFSWPHNYNQFKRVLNELAVITDSLYIKTESVKNILKNEVRESEEKYDRSESIDVSRTLEEINLDIVRQVLNEEKGNQSSTAKRLGISRTTLWRMMQNLN